jgi:hypothetical protein
MPFFRSIAQINTSSQTASVPMSTFSPPLLPDPVVPASRACRRRNDTRHVPGTCRRPPGPVGVAVPLRDSTRHHGGRDAHLRLVAPRHTPRLVGLPASYLRPDGVRGGGLRRAPWADPPGRARLRRDSLRRDGGYLTTAALLAPFTAPLPQVLGLGTLILAVPWWTHRRRRPMQDQALTRGVPDDQVPFLPADLVPVEREARAVRLGDIEAPGFGERLRGRLHLRASVSRFRAGPGSGRSGRELLEAAAGDVAATGRGT